jgi:hypothetical protein
MNGLHALTATKTATKCTISSASGCLSPTEIRCGGLVAVLVAVGFLLSCFSVRRGARPISLVSVAMKRFMRLCATLCENLQKRHLGTQNPPTARSWGFDPPSRHQDYKGLKSKTAPPSEGPFYIGGCSGGCWFCGTRIQAADGCLVAVPAIRSTTESLCAGERWLYRADIVIVLCPAAS